jgi:hypothetical protein
MVIGAGRVADKPGVYLSPIFLTEVGKRKFVTLNQYLKVFLKYPRTFNTLQRSAEVVLNGLTPKPRSV